MKIVAAALLVASASAFAPATHRPRHATLINMVDLANGAMSFDKVCREWRCKYEGDAETSETLEAIIKLQNEYLPQVKKASKDAKCNRLVCGGCLDWSTSVSTMIRNATTTIYDSRLLNFNQISTLELQTTVPLEDFGPWEESGFAPEAEFLEKLKAIKGVSQVETQTITKMEI